MGAFAALIPFLASLFGSGAAAAGGTAAAAAPAAGMLGALGEMGSGAGAAFADALSPAALGAASGGGGGLMSMLGSLGSSAGPIASKGLNLLNQAGQGAGDITNILGLFKQQAPQAAPIAQKGPSSPFQSSQPITAQSSPTGMGSMGNNIMQMIQKLLAGGQG